LCYNYTNVFHTYIAFSNFISWVFILSLKIILNTEIVAIILPISSSSGSRGIVTLLCLPLYCELEMSDSNIVSDLCGAESWTENHITNSKEFEQESYCGCHCFWLYVHYSLKLGTTFWNLLIPLMVYSVTWNWKLGVGLQWLYGS